MITASIPIYFEHYWYGVVAMDFSFSTMTRLLADATDDHAEGEYQLYDSRLNLIASSESPASLMNHFDEREMAQIAHAIESDTEGGIRLGSRFISWDGSITLMVSFCGCIPSMKAFRAISVASA